MVYNQNCKAETLTLLPADNQLSMVYIGALATQQ
ncbi:hypothetical protein Mucpa_2419 [Mucilaginibacter paludis DSM 18603]|uniref:Uncharacterized protein n=1 Tax=Mucilaginibacter paludis DSM 18603 TaxID=714943 RepID=H1YIH6_9SPHI|nr:hypothetical protein Mucpa_2419 [Mucilaginibacter paludis DSM 18603]